MKWLLVTSPKVHWSEGSPVRKVTGPNSNPNPNPYPNPNRKFVTPSLTLKWCLT